MGKINTLVPFSHPIIQLKIILTLSGKRLLSKSQRPHKNYKTSKKNKLQHIFYKAENRSHKLCEFWISQRIRGKFVNVKFREFSPVISWVSRFRIDHYYLDWATKSSNQWKGWLYSKIMTLKLWFTFTHNFCKVCIVVSAELHRANWHGLCQTASVFDIVLWCSLSVGPKNSFM